MKGFERERNRHLQQKASLRK